MKIATSGIKIYLALLLILTGCNKQSEIFKSPALKDYYPTAVGKIFIYRMDSTVPASFGSFLVVHSYQAKDSVEAKFLDNEGNESYRIFRTIRDTAGTQPWRFAATYTATFKSNAVEFIDNNMRFIKLRLPLTEGYSWKAHSYIDTKSLNSNVTYLDEWEYQYQKAGEPYSVLNKTYDSTITVFQHDETSPPGPFDPNNYQQRNFGTEVYAKGVGMIFKDFLHWTYQTTPPPSKYEDGSYGVKLRLISHN